MYQTKKIKIMSQLSNKHKTIYKIPNQNTDLEVLRCGLPQGSILGSLFFLIFINDLKKSNKLLDRIMFTADTNLFYTNKYIKV